MKAMLVISALIFSAAAHAAPDSLELNCEDAKALVATHGEFTLNTGDYRSERFVADASYCQAEESAKFAWIQAKDTANCKVGLRCVRPVGR